MVGVSSKGIAVARSRLRRALDLVFAGAQALDPRITFSRTTNATLTNSAGLVANAPMNLLTFSEQFDNAAWAKTNVTVTTNAIAAPNGTVTADKLIGTIVSAQHRLNFTPTSSAGMQTFSVYAKAGEYGFAWVRISGVGATFNLTTGSVGLVDVGVTASMVDAGNGWYRCIVSAVAAANDICRINLNLTENPTDFAGDGTSGIYIWGAQLEIGSTATTYNPTTVKNLLGYTEHFDNAAWTKSNAFVQTNLVTYSQDFDNAAWAKLNSTVVANTSIAPDGTTTADRFISAGGAYPQVFQDKSIAAGTYTASIYVKSDGTSQIEQVLILDGTSVSFTPTSEWTRVSVTKSGIAAGTKSVVIATNSGAAPVSSFYIWGAQLVQGTSAGDYKATYAAAAAVGYTDIYGQPFAQKLVEDTANNAHYVNQSGGVVGNVETRTIYAKAAERTWLYLGFGSGGSAYFDLVNGVLGTVSGVTAAITAVGNDWFRCSVGGTRVGNLNNVTASASANGVITYTGDGTSGIYIFGAQLSDSASVDPYVYQPVAAPASTAYYGPRFDYDPVTLAPRGLLIEEQRTNLITYSEQFDNAAWTKSNLPITPNATTAPDGSMTADKAIANVESAPHSMFLNASVTAGATYTGSYYAKAAGLNFLQITGGAAAFGASQYANFDLQNGVLGTVTGGTATITSVGNGWYRCSFAVACTTTGIGSVLPILVTSSTAARAETFSGNGVDGLYLWGAQLEAGAFATSYIPTVASQVTRAADSASMIGNNFARWYNPNTGTFYLEASGRQPALVFSNATSGYANYRSLYRQPLSANQPVIAFEANAGVTSANLTLGLTDGNPFKAAYAYATNNFAGSLNGAAVVTDTSGTPALAVDRMGIGTDYGAGAAVSTGLYKRIAFYSRALSPAEEQGITA